MNQKVIEKYVEEVLGKQLNEFKISENTIQKIKENIKENMYSLIFHWKDVEFRKGILITAMEEATFYEPDADIDIKSFVVVTIRNSWIEEIFSVGCSAEGLDKPINENEIKNITSEAIQYFRAINFQKMSDEIELQAEKDKYLKIVEKYPLAWRALIELGSCIGKRKIYQKEEVKEKIIIEDLNKNEDNKKCKEKIISEIQSGISEEISPELIKILKYIMKKPSGVFYADCFKMVTRNLEKLLKIIEIILENECSFVTSNYMLANNYVGKRDKLYRAAHTDEEMMKKLEDIDFLNNISKTHRRILKSYIEQLKQIN